MFYVCSVFIPDKGSNCDECIALKDKENIDPEKSYCASINGSQKVGYVICEDSLEFKTSEACNDLVDTNSDYIKCMCNNFCFIPLGNSQKFQPYVGCDGDITRC